MMNNKNKMNEAETVCVLTMMAMNLLLLTIVGGAIWSVYTILSNANFLRMLASGNFFN